MVGKNKITDKRSDLRQRAEEMLLKRHGKLNKIAPADVRRLFHELQVHQIELEMQNEELRSAQRELEASREKYFDLYDMAPVGYVTLNKKGIILETNLTAAALLGKERSDLVNQPLQLFLSREDQDTYYLHHKRLFEICRHQECEVRMLKGDGTRFWARLEAEVVRGNNDELTARTIINDITENKMRTSQLAEVNKELEHEMEHRKKVEAELISNQEQLRNLYLNLQSVREEERANAAREIHDELGQFMIAVKMDIAWLKGKYSDHKEISEKTSSTLNLVNTTIQSVKKICDELRPDILNHLGLGTAMQWQAEEFKKKTGMACEVAMEEGIQFDSARSIALFRIFQEALTNILCHAKATKVTASLKCENDKVILEISDNGKGITEKELSKPESFGLIGIRERVYPWRGSVTISSIPNEGTRIEVVLNSQIRAPGVKSRPGVKRREKNLSF